MTRPRIAVLSVLCLVAVLGIRTGRAWGGGSGPAALHREGGTVFHRRLKREFRLHPRAFSLEREDADRILNAEERLPGLYEAVLRLVYLEQAARFPSPVVRDGTVSPAARREWLALCREGADRFVESLFVREPLAVEGEPRGTVLDRVSAALGLETPPEASGGIGEPETGPDPSARDRILRLAGFPEAHRISRGGGVRIDVIGPAGTALGQAGAGGPEGFAWDAALPVIEGPEAPEPAPLAAAAAPDATIRFRPVPLESGSRYRYWSALQTALAIEEAVRSGAGVVIVAASFARDYPALRSACLTAYRHHAVVVCPTGAVIGRDPEIPFSFPAHYTTTLAVAGARPDRGGAFVLPAQGCGSHFVDLSGPAPADAPAADAGAAALCGGAAALIASLMPPVESELQGQYFQRIREVLVRAADPRPLGAAFFDPRTGYGLLRAGSAVGGELEAYRARRKQVEADFERRMKERAEAEKKAAEERAAAEAKRRKRP